MATLEDMVENCNACGAELEIGQIGKCDSCQESSSVMVEANEQESAEALGFSTVQQMHDHQTWIENRKKNTRDNLYQVQVDGERFFTGDATSIGVLVGNLSGRNFDRSKENARVEHEVWLNYMSTEYNASLPLGAKIVMLSPEGVVLAEETIGGQVSI